MTEATTRDIPVVDFAVRPHRSLWGDALRRLFSNRNARLGMFIVAFFIVSTVYAHYFWEYQPKTDLDYSVTLKPPNLFPTEEVSSIHPFGTDKLGRDIFRRVVHGGWNSLRVGLVAVSISLFIGVFFGIIAGFFESMALSAGEHTALLTAMGFALGGLPAWIADQPVQMVLFGLFGAGVIFLDRRIPNPMLRTVIFPVVGLLLGGIPALLVSPYTALVTGILGLLIGFIFTLEIGGKLFSSVIMRAMDIILAFPSYLLAIAIVAFLGPGLEKGMIAIGVVGIPVYARLARSSVLSVMQKEYILAAQSVGEGHGRIIYRHVLPNILSPIIVQTTMGLASAILSAAALGFLGLGAIPPEPEWGAMLGDSYRFLASGAWWAVVFPGVAIMLSVLGFNLLGDGLRDALDPKLIVN